MRTKTGLPSFLRIQIAFSQSTCWRCAADQKAIRLWVRDWHCLAGIVSIDPIEPISTQSSSSHVEERDQELWGPWSKIVSDWFQQKTIKVFLIGPFKFVRERLNVRRVWRVSELFPTILVFSDSKTTSARLIRQNYWIFQFSIK